MTYSEYDQLTETLCKIENPNPKWMPDKSDVEERMDMNNTDDVLFLLWLSLTTAGVQIPEDATKRQSVLRKLYETVILVDDE